MDGSAAFAIAAVGIAVIIVCATAFVWLTADDDRAGDSDALATDHVLGGDASVHLTNSSPNDDLPGSGTGLAYGGEPFFHLSDDAFAFRNAGDDAAPTFSRHRGRIRLVK